MAGLWSPNHSSRNFRQDLWSAMRKTGGNLPEKVPQPPGVSGPLSISGISRLVYSFMQRAKHPINTPDLRFVKLLTPAFTSAIIAMSGLLSKSAVRAASTSISSSQMTKAAGDISSVFPSLRPDYQPDPLPPRFKDLKASLFEQNEDALKQSWQRLLPSLEEEVQKIKAKGSDVCILDLGWGLGMTRN